jgi:glycosyltransferase involved in cell wall biosynthesis
MPKLSIITINLNNSAGLQKTMASVFAQTFTDYEYLVIDGGSTDGSVDEIKNHQNKLVYWISEKDNGIYHAMNKGIAKAKGEYLLFLNSGDYLVNNEVLGKMIAESEDKDIVYGTLVVDDKGKRFNKEYPEHLNFSFFLRDTLPHPCTLIKRSLFEKIGLYDENLKSTSDWKFFLVAVCSYNISYKRVPVVFSVFTNNGISSRKENREWIRKDKQQVLQKYFPAFLDDYKRIDECELKLKDCRQRLINIENSRFWKMRNRLVEFSLARFFLRK